ncbi:MAG: glycosyltransferase [Ignavibacteriales bacterium]|nr:MAG: glycosyltransferase [Ignavibacteriaceae bacterium]MBW7872345.1 glycosyltransferase [Ignavibacteria bacterium]MCZ2142628.1 glycosyltransferase [Ignavibacteriales bacterium]OQY74566.1 MAG: hypothetical protein B6D45_06675 [Ignavibacteriales bacterium UTCHB3]MBV6445508.1 hypothetical protein [Ignavibacteriaceae bacterium]
MPYSFSIVVPVLNEEKLLPKFFEEINEVVFGAEGREVEIIVSDGGSRDTSREIARRYTEKVIDLSDAPFNNIASGRNAGAKAATGDIILFCNADIRFENPSGFLKRVENEFNRNPKLIALSAWVRVFPEEEKLVDKCFHTFYNCYFSFLNATGIGMGRGECIIVKRDKFVETGGFDESLPAGEDFELFNRLIKLGKVKYSSKIKVFESPRRFREAGYLRVTAMWTANATSIYFRKRAISDSWKQVR